MSAAATLLARAREAGATIATAESCTGGLLAGAITEVPGASDVFERGFVTYSNAAKIDMLGVRPETLAVFGAVSEAVAHEMALGALKRSNATCALSVTGVAGPGGSENKPEGRVCFGLSKNGWLVQLETREFGAIGRREVRQATVERALNILTASL